MNKTRYEWPYKMQPGSQQIAAKLMSPQSPIKNVGFGGPKGGGKSFFARGFSFTITYQLSIVVILIRSRLKVLERNHIQPAKNELRNFMEAGLLSYNDTKKAFTWAHTGGQVLFAHAERSADVDQFDGIAADVYIFEEAGHFSEMMIKGINKNNRSSDLAINRKSKYKPKTLYTFNWGGRGHSFLRRVFWDRKYLHGELGQDFKFVFAPLDQNVALRKSDPGYEQRLKELPDQLRKAYLEGDPDAFIGSMFTIIDSVHQVDPEEVLAPYNGKIPDYWDLVGSLDAATGGTTSFGLYALTPQGKRYKITNYYVSQQNPKVHVDNICELIESEHSPIYKWTGGRKPDYIVSDPFAFAKKEKYAIASNDYTWKDLFEKKGYWLYRVKYNRVTAITALQTALHFEFEDGDITQEPDLQFFKGMCDPTIQELNEIMRDSNNPEDNAHGPDDKDDAIDETKNFIMTASSPPPRDIIDAEQERVYSSKQEKNWDKLPSYGHYSIESEMPSDSIEDY